jgi:predicted RNase H-like nuclease
MTGEYFAASDIPLLMRWARPAASLPQVRKQDQDKLDACLCLVVALELVMGKECLMVGDTAAGYIVTPGSSSLQAELANRCRTVGRLHEAQVRRKVLTGNHFHHPYRNHPPRAY